MRTTTVAAAVAGLACACGPSVGAGDGEGDAGAEAGEPEDDLAWLVGKYNSACGTDFESTQELNCLEQRYQEVEFHEDGTMTGIEVLCGSPADEPELAVYAPGPEAGTATLKPAAGFDHVRIGFASPPEATLHRTEDCLVLEIRFSSAGTDYVRFYHRGAFTYPPPVEGCATELEPLETPTCADE